eukprot:TRINITY_DN17647_c0_g1_i1.p1 TRINITY_DN17647_c0_g1~~TRINITY_DN17647_c0_g1_i1.p1  ORF type:complete len:386 (-),score=117.33 TRINITY_DN17647_c0_g1_i1:22-1179(-)
MSVSIHSIFFFFFKQKTAYEMLRSLVGSEMCIRDRPHLRPSVAEVDSSLSDQVKQLQGLLKESELNLERATAAAALHAERESSAVLRADLADGLVREWERRMEKELGKQRTEAQLSAAELRAANAEEQVQVLLDHTMRLEREVEQLEQRLMEQRGCEAGKQRAEAQLSAAELRAANAEEQVQVLLDHTMRLEREVEQLEQRLMEQRERARIADGQLSAAAERNERMDAMLQATKRHSLRTERRANELEEQLTSGRNHMRGTAARRSEHQPKRALQRHDKVSPCQETEELRTVVVLREAAMVDRVKRFVNKWVLGRRLRQVAELCRSMKLPVMKSLRESSLVCREFAITEAIYTNVLLSLQTEFLPLLARFSSGTDRESVQQVPSG